MKIYLVLLFALWGVRAKAQTTYFEGQLQYQVTVHSRQDGLSDQDVTKILATGPSLTVYMKDGRYRRSTVREDEYFLGDEPKIYIKFAKIDTLYWTENLDTAVLTGVVKSDSVFKVDGYLCKGITLNTAAISRRYYYSPDLISDPRYDSMNRFGHFDVYRRETGDAIYLWSRIAYPLGVETDSCVGVEKKGIDEHVFDLPALPRKKFDVKSVIREAEFPGGAKGWLNYLQNNLDSKLAAKYVKLRKGEDEAEVTVYVTFVIDENGQVSHINVVNRNEVHPKLAAEAERVIRESPRWQPLKWYGEKTSSMSKQPIVFKVQRS